MSDAACSKIAIHGAAGRMGRRLIALGNEDSTLQLVGALESSAHPQLGQDSGSVAGIGEIGLPLACDLPSNSESVIDFSVPAGAEAITAQCVAKKIGLVMATTGLSEKQRQMVVDASQEIAVVCAPNMSLAVNLTMKLTEIASAALKNHNSGVDVEIIERHHRYKEDSPSGTALKFGEIVAQEMGQTKHAHGREGLVGQRPQHEIGYHAVRVGDNPGEHNIIFGLLGETVELRVAATNRDCYALGALTAAKFAAQQSPGMYNMFDVLGI